jgi:hypothetical protein
MTTLQNNFEGGPDGTTMTVGNSNQSGTQDPFDFARAAGGGVLLQYASANLAGLNRPTAEYVMKISTGSGTATTFPGVGWTSSFGTLSELWARFYVYFTSTATNTNNDLGLLSMYTAASIGHGVSVVMGTGTSPNPVLNHFYIYNHNTSLTSIISTLSRSASTWYRVEFHAIFASSATGVADLYIYEGNASDDVTPTASLNLTGQNYGTTSIDTCSLGEDVIYQANTPNTYFSNWELNNTGYPGPAPFRQGLGSPSGNLTNPIAIHTDVN